MRILFFNLAQLLRRFAHRHGAAHDFAAGRFEIPDLLHRGAHVARVGLGHRLHGDRRIAADFDLAELDRSGFAALNHVSTIENRRWRVNKLEMRRTDGGQRRLLIILLIVLVTPQLPAFCRRSLGTAPPVFRPALVRLPFFCGLLRE